MAIPHAAPNEIIDVRPLGREIREQDSQLLIRTEHLEGFATRSRPASRSRNTRRPGS